MLMTPSHVPSTPTKPRNDHVNSYVDSLAVRWGLPLRGRDKNWSPSKKEITIEEEIIGSLKFLYYKDPSFLSNVIAEFDKHVFSWLNKLHSDAALPGVSYNKASAHLQVGSPENVGRITEELCQTLSRARSFFIQQHGLATNVNRDALHLSTSLSAFANRVSSMPSVSRKDAAISLPNTGLPQHASKAKGSRPVQSSKGSFSECFTELQTLWDVSDSQPKGSTNDPAFHGFSRFSNSYPNPIPQGSRRQPSVSKPLEHSQPQKLREAFLSRDGNEKLQAGVSLSTISLEGIKNDSQTQWGPGTVTSSEIEYVPIASHLGPKDKINIKKRSLAAEHSSSMPRKSPKGSHLNDTPFFHKVKTSTTAPKSTPYTHKNQYSDLKDSWRQKVNANDSFSTTSSFGEAMTSDISMSRVSAHPPEFTESFSSVQGKIIEESSPGIGGKEVIDLESEEFDMLDVIESMQVLFQMPFPLSLGILTRKVETSQSSPSQLSSSLRDVSIDSRDVATDKPRTEKVDGVPEMDVPIPSIEPGATLSLAENELLLYLDRHLMKSGPFAHDLPPNLCALPFRERYEIYRVARKCGTPLNKLEMPFSTCRNNQKLLWRWLHKHVSVHEDMPEPTPARVWKDAGDEFQNVSLAGDLAFNNTKGGPLFRFQLKALKSEDSNRIGRRFGGDRLLVLGIPSLDKRSLPSFLQPQADQVRHLITAWLVVQPHRIIGRTWKAFYVKKKSDNKKKKAKNLQTAQESQNEVQSLVYLFAVDGKGFRRPEYSLGTANTSSLPKKHEHTDMHTAMSVENLLRWLIDLDINKNMTAHKAFSRIALGVSKTQPTITFEPLQIRRIPDIWSPKTLDSEGKKSISEVMNDGCARISRRAAYEIAERLGSENHIPSAFQGRIAGAKGLWMVDCSYRETHIDKADEEFWIEITDSQSKFETHPIDEISPDDDRVTFEVNGVSSPLSSASLNFQLLPILEDRGVPRTVIADLLKEDLNFHVTELKAAMHSPLTFRKWSSDNRSTNSERAKNAGITWDASVPLHDTEKINWLLESGFHPQSCHFLKEIIWKVTKEFCMSLEERLHIGVGQSTYVYCVADPLGVLEEGEIHFGFSTTFKDPKSGFQETILHDVDALVARLPAHLQSDIQRVRCVFRPELRALKDVVVFSTKGQRPLAQYLSGGDYDGDKVFCCWDQRIVQPFQNAGLPAKTPSIKDLGITQDSTTLADIDISRTVTQFLHRSFQFVMQPKLLGWCTRFQEDMCYARNSINHPGAVTVATLLGLLVDSEKQGYTFTEADWNKLKSTNPHIYPKNPKVPAYRPGSNQKPTNHIIDYLKFSIARGVREDSLRDLNERFKKVQSCDFDLVALYKREEADAMSSPQLQAVLRKLNDDIQGVYNHWRTRVSVAEERRAEEGHFTSALGATYTRFLAILPPSDSSHEVVKRWWREEDPANTTTYSTSSFTSFASFTSTATAATSFTSTTTAREEEETVGDANHFSHWKLLRASAAFAKFHNMKFVWYVAGRQLGFLKARIGREPVMLRGDMHAALKVDGGFVRKVGRREEEEG